MSETNCIAILMAVYNGEKYLADQIDSILRQTHSEWVLYIHDDGSKDSTLAIVSDYVAKYPEKIHVLSYPSQGGACRNFLSLLERVNADYYMFSDQDDVWKDDKVEREWIRLQGAEHTNPNKPVIVFSDLIVTDSALKEVHPSLWTIAGIYPDFVTTFNEMAANTLVTGCTMLFNSKVKAILPATAQYITMHDAWLACCTMKNGGILCPLYEPTVLYRQHAANTLGAQNVASMSVLERMRRLPVSYRINKELYLMLNELSYGSIFKYLWFKYQYHKKIKNSKP
jgi:rhamnosyltransferase